LNRKFTSTVAGASILLACIGILSRSIGFFREIIYANTFGINKDFDIYLVGAVLPVILNSSIIYLSQNYFIPEYHRISAENKNQRENFLVRSFWSFIFIGIFVAFILFILKGSIIDNYLWNSDNRTKEISTVIFELFIFSIPFNAGYSVLASYLQA
jgi:putative peptidoglycan lipid II flippase